MLIWNSVGVFRVFQSSDIKKKVESIWNCMCLRVRVCVWLEQFGWLDGKTSLGCGPDSVYCIYRAIVFFRAVTITVTATVGDAIFSHKKTNAWNANESYYTNNANNAENELSRLNSWLTFKANVQSIELLRRLFLHGDTLFVVNHSAWNT